MCPKTYSIICHSIGAVTDEDPEQKLIPENGDFEISDHRCGTDLTNVPHFRKESLESSENLFIFHLSPSISFSNSCCDGAWIFNHFMVAADSWIDDIFWRNRFITLGVPPYKLFLPISPLQLDANWICYHLRRNHWQFQWKMRRRWIYKCAMACWWDTCPFFLYTLMSWIYTPSIALVREKYGKNLSPFTLPIFMDSHN